MSARGAARTARRLGMLAGAVAVALALTGGDAHAQTTKVTGKVVDLSTGDRLEGATVSFKHVATGRVFEIASTRKGTYRLVNVPFGAFEVTVVREGYQTLRTAYHVEARSSEATVVNVELARR